MPAEPPRRYQGEIVEWNDEKKCGFVRPRGSTTPGHVVFLPAKSLRNRSRQPRVGDTILYEAVVLDNSPKNRHLRSRVRAENATYQGEEAPAPRSQAYHPPVRVGAAYLVALAAASLFVREAMWILIADLCLSLLAFAQYGLDKGAAKADKRRIPENTLHLTALLGGWPGAAVAQQVFRHKTQKQVFQTTFKVVAILNVFATVGVLLAIRR